MTNRLPGVLLRFATSRYGPELVDEAWEEFTLYEEQAFNPESIHLPVFIPWFLNEWEPDPAETIVPAGSIEAFPLAVDYLARRGRYEDELTRSYLEASRASVFSFLDVLDVRPGSRLTMRDVLTGWEGAVVEKTASQMVRTGDILFARVVSLDGLTILDGCAPIAFPPVEKAPIIELRKFVRKRNSKITAGDLRDYRLERLEAYHSIADRLLDPPKPVLQNTDGDPLAFCRVSYEVPSARAAFDALRDLSLGSTEAELLAEASFDQRGELETVEIPWLGIGHEKLPWEYTGLGQIRIEGRRMVAEVNSEARAEMFRAIADRRLPDGSRYLSTVVESVDAALEAYREEHPEGPPETDLDKNPEAQAVLKEHLRAHYRAWPDMRLPALNGKTPRQAMRTRDGREMVEALLQDLEQKRGQMRLDNDVLLELKTTLGVAVR